MMKPILFLSLLLLASPLSNAQTYVSAEGDLTWQSRNDQRIPGDSGTNFSLSDFKTGPFPGYRLYVGHKWNERHELRALYAPLAVDLSGKFDKSVDFQGTTFAANTETSAYYKFNSYRLTYAYHFEHPGSWRLALGFTGKIRDAEVRLTQGNLYASKKNVGFVPLVNFQARRSLGENWTFRFDMDGLAAPQGRAFDAGLFLERTWETFTIFSGYRTIEGGADNDRVYNFAWIHKFVIGAYKEF